MENKQKIKNMLVNYLVHHHGGASKKQARQAREEVRYVIKKDKEYRYIKMFIAAERKRLVDMNTELDALEELIKSSSSESSP